MDDPDSFDTVYVSTYGNEIKRRLLFASPVVEASNMSRLAWLELETFSKDQGWCSDPSAGRWSWFEVGIVRPSDDSWTSYDEQDIIVPTSSESRALPTVQPESEEFMAWESHCNTLAGEDFEWLRGEKEFGPDHEIWTCLQAGDRI
ncbi:hypothetical protein FRC01_007757, partial [Tulasnella sp. 417]